MTSFDQIIQDNGRFHLVGIGGVSMSALAELLLSKGAVVSGSDRDKTPTTERLRKMGADIQVGHDKEKVKGAAVVIRTAAVHDDNPEIMYARELNIPVLERAYAWGIVMKKYEHALCIAGTHGKTTTTSMAAHIAIEAGRDPAVMVGGSLPSIGGGTLRRGGNHLIIAESCEYCNSFLNFHPTYAVILNIEEDHLDFFENIDAIIASFRKFALLTPPDGAVIVNGDDINSMKAVQGIDRKIITFGLDHKNDVYADNIADNEGYFAFDVFANGKLYTRVQLRVPGKHNIYNALACCAAANLTGISSEDVHIGLESFHGTGRRFEFKGTFQGADIVDDYAHHPSEMRATLASAKDMNYDRVICIFQPHTYTRAKAFLEDFAKELSVCDIAILCDIYAAREVPDPTISSKDIADRIPGSRYCPTFDDVIEYLKSTAKQGDLIITMGAGDVVEIANRLIQK